MEATLEETSFTDGAAYKYLHHEGVTPITYEGLQYHVSLAVKHKDGTVFLAGGPLEKKPAIQLLAFLVPADPKKLRNFTSLKALERDKEAGTFSISSKLSASTLKIVLDFFSVPLFFFPLYGLLTSLFSLPLSPSAYFSVVFEYCKEFLLCRPPCSSVFLLLSFPHFPIFPALSLS